jgi:hypothetical protein
MSKQDNTVRTEGSQGTSRKEPLTLLEGKRYVPAKNHEGVQGLADFAERMKGYAKKVAKENA